MAEANPGILTSACALELMHVRTADGRDLGRVFDLRCDVRAGALPTVTAIVYGERGLLERLGLRRARPTSIPWTQVRRIEGRVIVVDDADTHAR
jgi:sporulation protein YlmC with PRC-barrel domain